MKKALAFILAWMTCVSAWAQTSVYFAIPASSGNWASYSVPLVETAGWTIGSPSGIAPSQAEFQGILSRLSGLTISFDSNPQIFFDNVSLAGLVTSSFPACSTDGWMTGDNLGAGCNSLIGNPAGSINNGASPAAFNAPVKYLGDQSAAYGGNLSFDLRANGPGHVVLTGIPNPSTAPAGSMLPWGDNYSGQLNLVVSLTNVVALAAGRYHSLALKNDGRVATSGWNTYAAPDFLLSASQLSPSLTNFPTGLSNVVAVASGAYHNLALRTDGAVFAWGNNTYSQTNVPTGLTNVVAISAGDYHSLALRRDGTVIAWGMTLVQEGVTNIGPIAVPTNLTDVVAVAGGGAHSLALRANGTVVAWGKNNFGQTNVPSGLTKAIAITAGSSHNLALKEDATVVAWGLNTSGQTNVPVGLSNVVAIAAGGFFSLALRADGTVIAWGSNTFGQTNTPAGLANVNVIAGGGYHALALIGSGPPISHGSFQNPTIGPGGFQVSLASQQGRVYRLEYRVSLADTDWIGLSLSAGNGGLLALTDPASNSSGRFYRVRRW